MSRSVTIPHTLPPSSTTTLPIAAARMRWAASTRDAVSGRAIGSGVITSRTVLCLAMPFPPVAALRQGTPARSVFVVDLEVVVFVVIRRAEDELHLAVGGLQAVHLCALEHTLSDRVDEEHRRSVVPHHLIVVAGVIGDQHPLSGGVRGHPQPDLRLLDPRRLLLLQEPLLRALGHTDHRSFSLDVGVRDLWTILGRAPALERRHSDDLARFSMVVRPGV